jgi:hypothetical protein
VFKRLFAGLRAGLIGDGRTPSDPAMLPAEPTRVEEAVDPADSRSRAGDRSPSRERIAINAYYRWLSRGKPIGTDLEDWFEAERQLRPTA